MSARPAGEALKSATAELARLAQTGVSAAAQKQFLLAFVVLSVLVLTYLSLDNPRSLVRRLSAGYVADIDAKQKWMFAPPSGAMLAWMQAGTLFCIVLAYGAYASEMLLVGAAMVVVLPPGMLAWSVARRRKRIDGQAHGFALVLSNALKATASIGDALKGATDLTTKPLNDDLTLMLRHMRIGSTLEEALLSLSTRAQSPALDVVVSTLLIGRQTGGDLPRILETTSASLRDLKRLEEHTDKVVRNATLSMAIASAVTLGVALTIPRVMGAMFEPFKSTVEGQLVLGGLVVTYLTAIYLGYRFTRKSI